MIDEVTKISLPGKRNSDPQFLEIEQSIVIIGANGSGKTRFSAQIEKGFISEVHRITAQKSLEFPKQINIENLIHAQHLFRWGVYSGGYGLKAYPQNKEKHRYQGNAVTKPLNDFSTMVELLFAYHRESKLPDSVTKKSRLEHTIDIWESILPEKLLEINQKSIMVISDKQQDRSYNASEMSDGERATFYFIGSTLCAHENAIIVIDEPEMNLHSSIVIPLWNAIERARPDCKFIYLTHEINFCLSRSRSTKIWLKDFFENNLFDYEILKDDEILPSDLYIRILGTRKPVIFVEGKYDSLDFKFYSSIFPKHTIYPSGSCQQVITYSTAFRNKFDFHHINSFGIIDRDRRTDTDIKSLKKVKVLKIVECEHILLTEIVLNLILDFKGLDNEVLINIKKVVINKFLHAIDMQVFEHTKYHFKKSFDKAINAKEVEEYKDRLESFKSSIDLDKELNAFKERFKKFIEDNNYDQVLSTFNTKELLQNTSILELLKFTSKDEFVSIACTLLADPINKEKVEELKIYLGINFNDN